MTDEPGSSRVVARLFKNGRSQAVRLPKSMQLDAAEVWIWKEGERVILEPVPRREWPQGYWERLEELAPDLVAEDVELAPALLEVDLE